MFDLTKKNIAWNGTGIPSQDEIEGEATRLYMECTGVLLGSDPEIIRDGGIDLETATFEEIKSFLDNPPFPLSESNRELCRRTMKINYPDDFNSERANVSKSLKVEYLLIHKKPLTNDSSKRKFLGECGFLDNIRLDGSLHTPAKFVRIKRKK